MKRQIAERIRQARTIALCSHVRPDADSIGSGLALLFMLRQLGKDAVFINADRAPYPVSKLPGCEQIQNGQIFPRPFDLLVLIEGSSEERTGQKRLQDYACVHIDHHAASGEGVDLQASWVVPGAAAVGELVYELGLELGVEFSRDIAFNLYAAIAADTGSFKYSNTTPASLAIAADLARRGGFSPFEVSDLLFNSNSQEKVLMLTRVLSTLQLELGGRLAMIHFRRDFLDRLSLKDIETEDIIAIARSIDGVQVLLFFKEIAADYFRVSIRSRGDISARQVALAYQGGGHAHAAGFFYRGSLERAKQEIARMVADQFR
ncbi:MAG: bifunctional oligoribonuclease/PAP phosphatase NrnA [Acidobacteria bacterium]|jgi:phosphoesterase RecJ-like protein|nr:bifunctional oligoribonuclease/PAP phosphatase NrnA [Acidobacteriota bacterium]